MHKSVFFGDSFTAGENANFCFVDYLSGLGERINLGVSGTTFGEYSIYPVDGQSLIENLKKREDAWKDASKIFLEYGINDVSAILSGFVSDRVVLISFVKALDLIKQVNPEAEIYFLSISDDPDIIYQTSELQCNYLSNNYFSGFSFDIPSSLWYNKYTALVSFISKRCRVIPMIENKDFYKYYLSSDKIHPTDRGNRVIGKTISMYIK